MAYMGLTREPPGSRLQVRGSRAPRQRNARPDQLRRYWRRNMAATKLSSATVESLPYQANSASWTVHWHHKVRGFGLRVTEQGARTYVVRYRLRGSRSQKLKALGSTEKFTFGEAMENARNVLRLASEGRDWFDEIRRKRAQTLGEVWRYYETEHLAGSGVSDRTRGDAK